MLKKQQGQTSPIPNHTALLVGVHALRRYLKLICQYDPQSFPNKKLIAQRIKV